MSRARRGSSCSAVCWIPGGNDLPSPAPLPDTGALLAGVGGGSVSLIGGRKWRRIQRPTPRPWVGSPWPQPGASLGQETGGSVLLPPTLVLPRALHCPTTACPWAGAPTSQGAQQGSGLPDSQVDVLAPPGLGRWQKPKPGQASGYHRPPPCPMLGLLQPHHPPRLWGQAPAAKGLV